jgi:SAM-dependent methyltransferase
MKWFDIKQILKLHLPKFCNDCAIDWWFRKIRKSTVISGPFAGTRYISESYGSSLYPKLLGTYEKELSAFWDSSLLQSVDTIINIGCGEGYYLAGLGRLSQRDDGRHATLFGYDLSEKAIKLCNTLLEQNGLSAKSLVAGPFDGAGLGNENVLVVCDIEGAEESVMDPTLWPGLIDSILVIEVHDEPGETRLLDVLKARFAASHSVQHLRLTERVENDFPDLAWPWFTSSKKIEMLDEDRRYGKDWLVFNPHPSAKS